jgi:thioredoxin reductase
MSYTPDPASIAGKTLPVEERTDLLVIGAGAAGLACALAAAGQGRRVVVVDENPVSAATMADDVPLLFGGRTGAGRNAMMEAFVATDPAIAEAFEAGVDVRLGTACWGLYAPGPSAGWLPGPVAALMDEARSWMIGAEQVVVATGRRDMGLAFPGWELPGVMGATAALRLATRYQALEARTAVVLGSTAEALQAALAMQAAGVTIAAVVEQAAAPVGPVEMLARLGAETLCGHVLCRAEGLASVEAAVAVAVDGEGRQRTGTERRIACDTIVIGVGAVPVIELLDAAGCRVRFDADRGGTVPVLGEAGQTSVPGIFAAGDCAGIWPAKTRDPAIAAAEGRRCVVPGATEAAPHAVFDLGAYRLAWVRASVVGAEGAPHVCRCEEVTAREIMEVRPPRYLGPQSDRRNDRSLHSLLGEGPPNPDVIKRLTRAGMGVCQGRRCREQVAALLALSAGVDLGSIPSATHRAPVRPIPLALAAAASEPAGMAEHWDTWFGMPAQYRPPWNVIMPYTAEARDADEEVASE